MGALDGKAAIVTGGTSGIGEKIVELFVAEGAKVLVAARRQEEGGFIGEALRRPASSAPMSRARSGLPKGRWMSTPRRLRVVRDRLPVVWSTMPPCRLPWSASPRLTLPRSISSWRSMSAALSCSASAHVARKRTAGAEKREHHQYQQHRRAARRRLRPHLQRNEGRCANAAHAFGWRRTWGKGHPGQQHFARRHRHRPVRQDCRGGRLKG